MAISSHAATFTFAGASAAVTSISVESPQAEVVDMTRPSDAIGVKRMVATGDVTSPAKIRVDYLRSASSPDPLTYAGTTGQLSIAHSAVSVTKTAIVESISTEMSVGDLVRGSISFIATED